MLEPNRPPQDQRNMFIALGLSAVIYLGWYFVFEVPRQQERARYAEEQATLEAKQAQNQENLEQLSVPATGSSKTAPLSVFETHIGDALTIGAHQNSLDKSPRVTVNNEAFHGSINLRGGAFDDLTLPHYLESLDRPASEIRLFSPDTLSDAYFASFGWQLTGGQASLPNETSLWQANGAELAPGYPLTLTYDNGEGLLFTRRFEILGDYMLKVTQSVTNSTNGALALQPYALLRHRGLPGEGNTWISFEGMMAVTPESLEKIEPKKFEEYPRECLTVREQTLRERCETYKTITNNIRWAAVSDKYWMSALITPQNELANAQMYKSPNQGHEDYDLLMQRKEMIIGAGQSANSTSYLYAGAKKISTLDHYAQSLDIPMFDRAIDFGWFYWITKPFTKLLVIFNGWLGNYGLAILLLTIIVKLLFFPLAYRSYKSMAVMRRLQPKMQELKERYGEDRARMSQETMALYKKEGANPLSGCLPILLQIPVFFALYKTLFISIEMRHAPFFGWIHDLSAPDPTSIFNLFGLLPYSVPDLGILNILSIGIWPLIMGVTMWLQQRLSPKPTDPQQAMIMGMLPILFTFMLAPFPAGLVIYWSANNIFTAAQQWYIMRRTDEAANAKAAERKKKQ